MKNEDPVTRRKRQQRKAALIIVAGDEGGDTNERVAEDLVSRVQHLRDAGMKAEADQLEKTKKRPRAMLTRDRGVRVRYPDGPNGYFTGDTYIK